LFQRRAEVEKATLNTRFFITFHIFLSSSWLTEGNGLSGLRLIEYPGGIAAK